MKHDNWICNKCWHLKYEISKIRVSISFGTKNFNIQNKKYLSASYSQCYYTELYKNYPYSTVENIFDLFTN